MDLVGFENNGERRRVEQLHLAGDGKHFLAGAGAHHHVAAVLPEAAARVDDRCAAAAELVDPLRDGFAVAGDDERELSGIRAVHDLVGDDGEYEIDEHAIDDAVKIAENDAAEHHDNAVRNQNEPAERQMRVLGFERKRDKVRAAGGRVPHIDERVAQPAEHARAYGGDEPLAGVNRQERRYVVNKERGEDHAPDAAKKKPAAEQPVTEDRHRDVENDRHHADGQAEQPVEDQRETRKAGHRELCRQCKVIDGDAGQDAPGNFHERIEHPRLSEQLSHGGHLPFPFYQIIKNGCEL